MSLFGIGGGSSSQSSQTKPWKPQQQYLKDIYARAQTQADTPRSFYPEAGYVPFSGETEEGLTRAGARARGGSPGFDVANQYNQGVLRGDYLDPATNPWVEKNYDAAARAMTRHYKTATLPNASLERYGRTGSSSEVNRYGRARDDLGRNLGELASRLYGQNYARERGVQEQAAGRSIPFAEYEYEGADRLGDIGAQREDLSGRALEDLMRRYYFKEDEPRERLAEYSGMIGSPVMAQQGRASQWNANLGFGGYSP